MNKRTTLIIDEDNWKRYEKIKADKLLSGQGDLSFTTYVNIVLQSSNLTLSQIVDQLKRRRKK